VTGSPPTVDVLIVGGGPTGLAVANALGAAGVRAVLIDQDAGVADLPRAVSIDDEAMRFMQRLGLRAEAEAVTLPGTGTKYFGARGQLLLYARGRTPPRYGFPVKNPMDHPEFQQMLLAGAQRFPNLEIKHRTKFLSLSQDAETVTAEIDANGARESITCRYLVGCDGGRSPVRVAIGEEPMSGSAFGERWLVVDTVNDPHHQRYAMHHGDPRRPHVVIVGRNGRCRYEFLVAAGEDPEPGEINDFARRLVAPYRVLVDDDIVRCTIYQFYALVARNWKVGRVLLAGDAAHMMPPFAGQGLNSGLRDAANLCWKLSMVVDGRAGADLLSTYQAERRPHVEATVQLSVRVGKVMMSTSRARAAVRDVVFAAGQRLPGVRRFFAEMRFKPDPCYRHGFAVVRGGQDDPAGTQLCQPRVLTASGGIADLDDVLGDGFVLLGLDVTPDKLECLTHPLWSRLHARRVALRFGDQLPERGGVIPEVADLDGLLADQLGDLAGSVVLVRPDRIVAGTFVAETEQNFAHEVETKLAVPESLRVNAEAA